MSTPELPAPLDVVAVGAHPDDVEIACGGTLARLARLGYRVGIIDLTNGEPTPLSPGPEHRMQEAAEAARILGVAVRETLPLPNRRLFDCFEARVALAKVFRRYRPRLVLGIGGRTPMASPDHWQAHLITDAAVFYARLTKWDEHFDHLPVHSVNRIVWYPLALKKGLANAEEGFIVADISDVLEVKLAAIRAYESQFPPAKDRVFTLVEALNRSHGALAGFEAGEVFVMDTPLGVADIYHTLLGPKPPILP